MRASTVVVTMAICWSAAATAVPAQPAPNTKGERAQPSGWVSIVPMVDAPRLDAQRKGARKPPQAINGIEYHNGPLLVSPIHVYFIWYGGWGDDDTQQILQDAASSIGGTPWFAINSTYWDRRNKRAANSVAFKGAVGDAYSRGDRLSYVDVFHVVTDAINHHRLPKDVNGVYVVLTSQDVDQNNGGSGFCDGYCGWHSSGKLGKSDLKFAFVGDSERCMRHCAFLGFKSPNDNLAADAMASIFAHELSEAATDPDLNAWFSNSDGSENADKCAWTFGDMSPGANGALHNVHWGGRDFMIQQNWVNAGGGYCALSYP